MNISIERGTGVLRVVCRRGRRVTGATTTRRRGAQGPGRGQGDNNRTIITEHNTIQKNNLNKVLVKFYETRLKEGDLRPSPFLTFNRDSICEPLLFVNKNNNKKFANLIIFFRGFKFFFKSYFLETIFCDFTINKPVLGSCKVQQKFGQDGWTVLTFIGYKPQNLANSSHETSIPMERWVLQFWHIFRS